MALASYAKVVKANGLENDLKMIASNENVMPSNKEEKFLPASPTTRPGTHRSFDQSMSVAKVILLF